MGENENQSTGRVVNFKQEEISYSKEEYDQMEFGG